ncbi:ribonuclease Z [Thermoflexus sp.]|uniref:ribonuclease Z n=1 Tax=Thermoflexus sp. TaxID=1969742 RepID=UPI0035E456B8
MIEIVFLGTSASAPSIRRGLPAHVVMFEDRRFLVDCGEGTQRQLLRSGLGFRRLETILLTHAHLDHILGLAGFLSTVMRWEILPRVAIYGRRGAIERVKDLIYRVVLRGVRPTIEISFHIIEPGVLFEDEKFVVHAFPVTHRGGDSLGYLFREKPRRPFLVEKAEALGIPPGPERRRLVQGYPVTLPDGRVVTPEEVLGPPVEGASLALVGDTGRVDDLVEAVQGVGALVIEATYLEADRELARRHDHITAAEAGWLARVAGVRHLILTHLSRRYRERQIREEAQTFFPHVWVARDFDRYRILKDGHLEVERAEAHEIEEERDVFAESERAGAGHRGL